MPELPEVETIRLGLVELLPELIVAKVDFDWPKSFPNAQADVSQFLIGSKIVKVRRRAKVLIIDLSSEYSLLIHLKMTGQLVYRNNNIDFGAGHPNDSLISKLPDKTTRVILELKNSTEENAGKLFFNDQRKFGWMKLIPCSEIGNLDFFQKVGPEPLTDEFSWQILKKRSLRRKNSNIKAVLLDQTILAGIGNIYADEALWSTKIHPETLVKDINDTQFKKLHRSIKDILQLSIDKGGSSNRNYVNSEGKKGSYMSFAKVFRREGQPCYRCGTTIEKIRVAGRGTHICPYCQVKMTVR